VPVWLNQLLAELGDPAATKIRITADGVVRAAARHQLRGASIYAPTAEKTGRRRVPDDGGSGSGRPKAGLESRVGPGGPYASGETVPPPMGAACGPFFELTERPGRIAPWT
jgi:hypothetical protein